MIRFSSFLASVVLALFLGAPAHAQNVIYVDGSASGAGDGSSWADAYTNPQTAIDNAAAGDEIWIADGVYRHPDRFGSDGRQASFTIPASKDGLKLYGGFQGDASETSLADRDPDTYEVILSGDIDSEGDQAFAPTEDSDNIRETATATDHIRFLYQLPNEVWPVCRIAISAPSRSSPNKSGSGPSLDEPPAFEVRALPLSF